MNKLLRITIATLALGCNALDAFAAPPSPGEVFIHASYGGSVYDPNGQGIDIAMLDLPPGQYLVQAKFLYAASDPATAWLFCRLKQAGVTVPEIMTVEPDTKHHTAVMFVTVDNASAFSLPVILTCLGGQSVSVQHVRMVATLVPGITIQP